MIELWADIGGFENLYEVSNRGRIRNARTHYVLRSRPDADDYRLVTLWRGCPTQAYERKVHRLVAQAFIHNPENKPQVNHSDFNRANNEFDNLVWATSAENIEHSRQAGRMLGAGHRAVIAYVGEEQCRFPSVSAVAKSGLNRKAVHLVLCGRQKTHGGFMWRYA